MSSQHVANKFTQGPISVFICYLVARVHHRCYPPGILSHASSLMSLGYRRGAVLKGSEEGGGCRRQVLALKSKESEGSQILRNLH